MFDKWLNLYVCMFSAQKSNQNLKWVVLVFISLLLKSKPVPKLKIFFQKYIEPQIYITRCEVYVPISLLHEYNLVVVICYYYFYAVYEKLVEKKVIENLKMYTARKCDYTPPYNYCLAIFRYIISYI